MIELGETDRALAFATSELAGVQELTDRVIGSGHHAQEPVVAALLLGKAAEAAERGIRLEFPTDLEVPDGVLPSRDLLTVLGNLIDNAFEATLSQPGERRVCVAAQVRRPTEGTGPAELRLRVSNSGPRITEPERIFERGWTTKIMDATGPVFGLNGSSQDAGGKSGRGLGLALVRQAVERNAGSIEVRRDERLDETVFEVRLPLPQAVRV